jgi:protein involved in polysaccharide export with SLBB domain
MTRILARTRLTSLCLCLIAVMILASAWSPHSLAQNAAAYQLGVGDKIHVIVYNEPDLTGDYDVNDQGIVSLPLIGQVHVAGMSLSQAQDVITQKYGANYLVNPRVNVQILNYRPFYVIGEVKNPGSYPYVNGMTVLNAVALAGGYTPRGNENNIVVKHADDPSAQEQKIGENDPVKPGDIIRVNQKLF